MGKRTSYTPGTFCWTDLATSDAEAAQAFYGPLLGWEFARASDDPEDTYIWVRREGSDVAGMLEMPDRPPAWVAYVSVESVDSTVERVRELGGGVPVEPFDLKVGRTCVVTDRQGAHLALWEPGGHIGAALVNEPGAMSLNQLNTNDLADARGFYGDLFGWRFEEVSSEPAYWGIFNGPGLNGGMMELQGPPVPPYWLTYFTTSDLDASVTAIDAGSGQVVVPPMQIQSGRIAVAGDPQGAFFALFEGQVDD